MKCNVLNPPVSAVVCAIWCVRHFSDFCDRWHKADDLVAILARIFTLSEDQKH